MYNAVIIEDEERSQVVLQKLLEKYCPDLNVVALAGSVQAGVDTVEKHKPEVLFLDVQLTDGSGFDILEQLEYSGMAVIFTTAYDQYAIKALRFSAIDYLLKPIDIEELRNAVARVTTSFDRTVSHQKIEHLIQNIRRDPAHDPVLLISTAETVEFIDIRDIVRCQADGAYCVVHMRDGHRYIASKLIKDFELLLADYGFFRVHQSHLLNLRELKKYSRLDNNLVLKDGTKIQLARSRKENFFKELGKLKI